MIAACDDFAADLVAYLDDELGDADRGRVEAHLGTCLACRRELEQFRRLRALIDGVRPLALSADFDERMRQRLDPLATHATRRRADDAGATVGRGGSASTRREGSGGRSARRQ